MRCQIKLLIFFLTFPALTGLATIHPVKSVLRLRLNAQPAQKNFSLYLVFNGYDSNAVLVKFKFKQKKNLIYESVLNETVPTELDKLQYICQEHKRDLWDNMVLENRNAIPILEIKRIFFKVTYNSSTKGCINDITILDWDLDQKFPQSYSKIYLNTYARFSRLKWVKNKVRSITGLDYIFDADTCPAFLSAVRDIGKCGTSGISFHSMNPKYGAGIDNLCSEFVSWYYHDESTPFGKKDFKDIVSATRLMNLFANVGLKYEYNNHTQQFEHSLTRAIYQPQPGDYLWRTEPGHAMMIAGWNSETKIAAVINGPWPVTLRTVEIQKDEDRSSKEYCIGRVNEIIKPKPEQQ